MQLRNGKYAGDFWQVRDFTHQAIVREVVHKKFPFAHLGDVEPARRRIDALIVGPGGRSTEWNVAHQGEERS